jgi:uncharacterized protein
VKDLVHKPGAMRELNLEHTLSENLGTAVIAVEHNTTIELSVRLESVHEGILVSSEGETLATSECSRCLEKINLEISIRFQELFHYQPECEDDFFIRQDLIDLEQPLIDSVVPTLPLQPLCADDCPGLCADCGEKLDVKDHHHEKSIDPGFDVLSDSGS